MSIDPVVQLSVTVPLDPASAFDTLVEELAAHLADGGMQLRADATGVTRWERGKTIVLEWRPASWQSDEAAEIEFSFEAVSGGTRVTITQRNWSAQLGDGTELLGWFASQAAAPMLNALSPSSFGDWITDRQARRPSGSSSRATYRDPLFHYPGFRVMLKELALGSDDYLLEVGCGGGAMLKQALASGCRAAAIDHSADMVRTAIETNEDAVRSGRLEVVEAAADKLPFADDTFTCAAMTGVLGFLPDPVAAFGEMKRVLRADGRIVIAGSDPELRGTPGAPEPMASRLHFYEDDEFADIAVRAGFANVKVVRRDLEQHARDVGIPEEYVFLFSGDGSRYLLARKS